MIDPRCECGTCQKDAHADPRCRWVWADGDLVFPWLTSHKKKVTTDISPWLAGASQVAFGHALLISDGNPEIASEVLKRALEISINASVKEPEA